MSSGAKTRTTCSLKLVEIHSPLPPSGTDLTKASSELPGGRETRSEVGCGAEGAAVERVPSSASTMASQAWRI